jgi:hypothetical protein
MTLELEAINPVRINGFLHGFVAFSGRWEVTCGLCRIRFQGNLSEPIVGSPMSWIACPECGTHNLLPHHPAIRGRGQGGR